MAAQERTAASPARINIVLIIWISPIGYNATMDFSYTQEFPEELKTEWNAFINNGVSRVPFLRYEYLKIWWQTRGGGEWGEHA